MHCFSWISAAYGYGYAPDTYPKEHDLLKKLCYGSEKVVSAVHGLNYTCRGDSFCEGHQIHALPLF